MEYEDGIVKPVFAFYGTPAIQLLSEEEDYPVKQNETVSEQGENVSM